MSGHAAADTLLEFARTSEADHIDLVYGSVNAEDVLSEHLVSNTDAIVELAETGASVTLDPAVAGALSAGSVSATEEELTPAEL